MTCMLDSDEVFTSIRRDQNGLGQDDVRMDASRRLIKRLELAEKSLQALTENIRDGVLMSGKLAHALADWEDATATSRRLYYDGDTYMVASGRGGLALLLQELGYDQDQAEWKELDPETAIEIWCDQDGLPGQILEGTLVIETAAEWCRRVPEPGVLCSVSDLEDGEP